MVSKLITQMYFTIKYKRVIEVNFLHLHLQKKIK